MNFLLKLVFIAFVFKHDLNRLDAHGIIIARYERLANRYLEVPVSCGLFSSYSSSGRDCCVTCNKETNCLAVNYNRLNGTCELLPVHPHGALVSSLVNNAEWSVYHKPDKSAESWVPYGDHCYLYNPYWYNWETARQQCQDNDADLVDIEDDAENSFVHVLAKTYSMSRFWIGLTDIETEGVWVWVTGRTSTYTNFYTWEPNGYGNENCVNAHHVVNIDQWNDNSCSEVLPSICKM